METLLTSAVSLAIVGAVITGVFSIWKTRLAAEKSHELELAKLSVQLAEKDFHHTLDHMDTKQVEKIRPLSAFVWFHYRMLKLIDSGDIEATAIEKHLQQYTTLLTHYAKSPSHLYNVIPTSERPE